MPPAPILLNDFKRQWQDLEADTLAATSAVGQSGWYILGSAVERLEAGLAERLGQAHACGCGNGMDALQLALLGLGLQPGQKVLTTPISAFATTLAIVRCGGVPVFADVDARGVIDAEACTAAFNAHPDLVGILPVHLYGQATGPWGSMRRRYGCWVIEDAAQAVGAEGPDGPVGREADALCLSFYPTKNLGALGDGGAVLCPSPERDARHRALRNYGTENGVHAHLGLNSRLDELQAAILLGAGLPRLESWTRARRATAARYQEALAHPGLRLPEIPLDTSVWHLFPVLVEPKRREDFRAHLKDAGVATGLHYPVAIPDQPAMHGVEHHRVGDLAAARAWCASVVSLPIHPYLRPEERERVVEAVNGWQG